MAEIVMVAVMSCSARVSVGGNRCLRAQCGRELSEAKLIGLSLASADRLVHVPKPSPAMLTVIAHIMSRP